MVSVTFYLPCKREGLEKFSVLCTWLAAVTTGSWQLGSMPLFTHPWLDGPESCEGKRENSWIEINTI